MFHPAVNASDFSDRKSLTEACQRAVTQGFDSLSGVRDGARSELVASGETA